MLNRTLFLGLWRVMFHLCWVLVVLMLASIFIGGSAVRPFIIHGAFYGMLFAEVAMIIGVAKATAEPYLYPVQANLSGPPGFLAAALLLMFTLPFSLISPDAPVDVNRLLLVSTLGIAVPYLLGLVWGYALKRCYKPAWDLAHKAYWLGNVKKLIDSLDEGLAQKGQRLQKTAGMNGNQLQRYYLHLYRARNAGVI